MKLRIHKSTLRFRFNVEEVAALGRGESVNESIALGAGADQRLDYRVLPVPDATGIAQVRLDGTNLNVCVDSSALRTWSAGAELALRAECAWEGGRLTILLEKDLQRLNPKPGEEAEKLFPNPLFGKARCEHP